MYLVLGPRSRGWPGVPEDVFSCSLFIGLATSFQGLERNLPRAGRGAGLARCGSELVEAFQRDAALDPEWEGDRLRALVRWWVWVSPVPVARARSSGQRWLEPTHRLSGSGFWVRASLGLKTQVLSGVGNRARLLQVF